MRVPSKSVIKINSYLIVFDRLYLTYLNRLFSVTIYLPDREILNAKSRCNDSINLISSKYYLSHDNLSGIYFFSN